MGMLVEGFDGGYDLQWRFVSLHQGGGEDHFNQRIAAPQDVQYVPDDGTRRRGDHAQAAGERWQGPLAFGGEEALGLQAFL